MERKSQHKLVNLFKIAKAISEFKEINHRKKIKNSRCRMIYGIAFFSRKLNCIGYAQVMLKLCSKIHNLLQAKFSNMTNILKKNWDLLQFFPPSSPRCRRLLAPQFHFAFSCIYEFLMRTMCVLLKNADHHFSSGCLINDSFFWHNVEAS